MLRKLFIKVWLYFRGMSFHRTTAEPGHAYIKRALFETETGKSIEFQIFPVEPQYYSYRFGKHRRIKRSGYLIELVFDRGFPNSLTRFNGLRLIFHFHPYLLREEKVLTRVILNAYLDYIHREIKKTRTDP